jgi:enterochelin esterase-like enzyme
MKMAGETVLAGKSAGGLAGRQAAMARLENPVLSNICLLSPLTMEYQRR